VRVRARGATTAATHRRAGVQPCLTVLGKAVELLEADDGVVRFLYHGLIRDKVRVSVRQRSMRSL
jgi:hypothetical protein